MTRVTRAVAPASDELSGALAHELCQPLTAILANAQAAIHLLARDPPDLQQVRAILEDIVHEDERTARVIARSRSRLRDAEGGAGAGDRDMP